MNSCTLPTHQSTPALRAHGVVRRCGETTVLHGVDLEVAAGESVALMGPSGSGKTTLLHVLAGIAVPDAGWVTLADGSQSGVVLSRASAEERARLRRTVAGLVFQSGQLLGELTAAENVALPLLLGGVAPVEGLKRARKWFPRLGLDGLAERRPGQLSGGQQQRVAIARALVTSPRVIFADEPTGALDQRTGREVMDLLLSAQRSVGAALVMVTHDPEVAARCDRVISLRDGVVEHSTSSLVGGVR